VRRETSDPDEIRNTLGRFMNSFDLKDWTLMAEQLEPRIRVDYRGLRGDPPQELDAADYVNARTQALQHLATHHLLGNVDVAVAGDCASVGASCMIWRSRGAAQFNSHAYYRFSMVRRGAAWKIGAIEQRIFWSEGDPGIHKGVGRGRESSSTRTSRRIE